MRLRDLTGSSRIGLILLLVLVLFGGYLLIFPPSTPSVQPGAAPVAEDDVVSLPSDASPITAHVTSNDRDPDGDLDTMSVAIEIGPEQGTAQVGLDGSIVYVPGADFPGTDLLEYEVCDSMNACDVATLTIRLRLVELSGSTLRFAVFGDYGDGSAAGPANVAALVEVLDPDFIVTTGDNSYDFPDYDLNVGQFYSGFIGSYQGQNGPGAAVNRFFPSLGDHEYSDGGIEPYVEYFTLPGEGVKSTSTSGTERYYDFEIGPVHVFVLNVQPQEPDGVSPRSIQGRWLQEQLAASSSPWQVVVSPIPPFSSGDNHGSDPGVQWPYDDWGADAVFSGDDHVYERIVHDGLPYFVSGLGGRSMYGFGPPVEGSEFRYADDFGVLLVVACDSRLAFEFHSIADGVVDRFALGTDSCAESDESDNPS